MSENRLEKIEKARKDIIEAIKDLHPSEGISLMEMIKFGLMQSMWENGNL